MVCCKCCQGYATLCRVFTYAWLLAAVIFSCFAVSSCDFLTRDETDIGLYRAQRPGEECVAYRDLTDWRYGWLHNWARTCGVLAAVFGTIMLALMTLDCCCNVCCSKYMQTFLVVCCQLNQGMTFVLFASNVCVTRKGGEFNSIFFKGCRMGGGSAMSLTAFWCYFIGGFFLCCSPKPNPLCNDKDEDNDGKKGCCGKEEKENEEDEKPAAQEEKPEEEEPDVVVAAAVVKKEERNPEATKDIEEANAEEKTKEDPPVVPVAVPPAAARSPSPPPLTESGTEIELDEEFGTSQIMMPMCCE